MSQPATDSTDATELGWLVIGPTLHPDAWYSRQLAADEAAAWRRRESNPKQRDQLRAAGWRIRAASWRELFHSPIVKVSA